MSSDGLSRHRLEVLSSVTQRFLETAEDVDALLAIIAREVAGEIGDSCGLWTLDETGQKLICSAIEGFDPFTTTEDRAVFSAPMVLSENQGARNVAIDGNVLFFPHFDAESVKPPIAAQQYYEYVKRRGIHSLLRVPLRAKGQPLGMLALSRFRPGSPPYDDGDVKLARALADHAALAILKARARRRADDALRDTELARAALRDANAAYQVLFDANPVSMFVFDVETLTCVAVNDAALALYGYTREEFLALPASDLRIVDDPDRLRETLASVQMNDAASRTVHRRKDRTQIAVHASTRALVFRGRQGRLCVVQDISAQEKLEEQLRQSQKMEAVGSLAGGVAHDFNNLLSVIIGYASLLQEELPPGAPNRLEIDEIRHAGDRAAALTRQLLAVSRRQILQPKDVDVNAVIGDMMVMLKRLVPENIELAFRPFKRPSVVRVDRSQLEQVLMNLVVNAKDAIAASGSITISTADVHVDDAYRADHLDIAPGNYSVVEVTDTGSGMDKATQERIFEPFFTTKEVGKGSGLGLSTVFGIVKQSGGSIWVYSELDKGTTFKVFLPSATQSSSPGEKPAAQSAVARGNETILLVEDEDQVRRLAQVVLTRAGYHVIVAAHGKAALATAEKHQGPIHLLLTDVVMPGMTGRELATALAASRPQMKALFMSGYTDDAVVRHGVLDSGLPFIQKPVLPTPLLEAVRAALGPLPA